MSRSTVPQFLGILYLGGITAHNKDSWDILYVFPFYHLYISRLEFMPTLQKQITQKCVLDNLKQLNMFTEIWSQLLTLISQRQLQRKMQYISESPPGPSSKHGQTADGAHHGNCCRCDAVAMMKMLGKWYGRSSTLMLIKLCYTVKAVCHKGLCESNQSLVTPLGIHQHSPCGRLIVLGMEKLYGLLFTGPLQ